MLVANEGSNSSAIALGMGMKVAITGSDTSGRPMPTTPFTVPPAIIAIAHAKTAAAPRPRKSVIVAESDDCHSRSGPVSRQLDGKHQVGEALAMHVLRERHGHAAAQRILDDKIECLELGQLVARDGTLRNVFESLHHPLDNELLAQNVPRAGVVRDDGNVRGVAF